MSTDTTKGSQMTTEEQNPSQLRLKDGTHVIPTDLIVQTLRALQREPASGTNDLRAGVAKLAADRLEELEAQDRSRDETIERPQDAIENAGFNYDEHTQCDKCERPVIAEISVCRSYCKHCVGEVDARRYACGPSEKPAAAGTERT